MDRSLDDGNEDCVIRVRGLPWSCTEQQLRKFFQDDDSQPDNISVVHFTYNREGRPSGEAYLKFHDSESYESALRKDKQYLNKRYVEVFPSKHAEMDYVVKHSGKGSALDMEANNDAIVRMRGLPYGCTKEEIASFFLGLEMTANGINILSDPHTGRATGEAFVQFVDNSISEKALQQHMQKIGHRYIEVFRSSAEERRRFLRRMEGDPPGRGGARGASASSFDDWTPRTTPPSLFASGYTAGGSWFDSPFGLPDEMMYMGRTARPTPYDRPYERGYSASRTKPTPLMAAMTSSGSFGTRSFDGGGRMAGSRGPKKGFSEGGYGGRAGRIGTGSGHYVHMRGLPYSVNRVDIVEFFSPLRLASVDILTDDNGRPSGEANVEFYTHADAVEAMKRDRDTIGPRYVELFLDSSNTMPFGIYGGYKDFSEDML